MKISGLEKGALAVTAAFLLVTGGYYWGTASRAEPYTVSANLTWTEQLEAPTPSPAGPEGRIDLNTAGADELEQLPGIGSVRAAEIVADREANGPFRFPEEITRVSGIGEGTLEQIIDYITVS